MQTKVTLQDIADALGLSRNTVSKAINNTGVLAEDTKKRILAKTIEMGYKQFSYINQNSTLPPKLDGKTEIAFVSNLFLNNSHFASPMLDKFQLEISRLGYSMSMHITRKEDIKNLQPPISMYLERIAGIICFEIFEPDYARMLTELNIPILFVDAPANLGSKPLAADKILMENTAPIHSYIASLKEKNITGIGFVGETLHCQSFFERYMAYKSGMAVNNLTAPKEWEITGNKANAKAPNPEDYTEYLTGELKNLKKLPDVFICANDFVAVDMLRALTALGYKVPEDVRLLGFDDSPESRVITPLLSTVHIHSQTMGYEAAKLLLSRIENPDINYRTLYCETNLILRNSTGETNE